MPKKIEQLAKSLLKHPVEIKLAVSKPAEKIKQSAYICHEHQKLGLFKHIFADKSLNRVIVFSGKKEKVKEISRKLNQIKVNAGEMHSDLTQAERDEVMFKFKSQQIDVLVATDIVARGIDIDDIQMVINYDVPHDVEDYVHRIGRTARADRDGCAITFVSEPDFYYFQQIEQFLEKEIVKNPVPPELGEAPEYKPVSKLAKKSGRYGRKDKGKGSKGKDFNKKARYKGKRNNGNAKPENNNAKNSNSNANEGNNNVKK